MEHQGCYGCGECSNGPEFHGRLATRAMHHQAVNCCVGFVNGRESVLLMDRAYKVNRIRHLLRDLSARLISINCITRRCWLESGLRCLHDPR